MNSSELADKVAASSDLPKGKVKPVIDALFAAIADAAARGDDVSITGFGKFKVKATAARTARHVQTGEPIHVPASRKVSFAPSQALKDRVAG
ncbi:MAG: HU family DNA-binding protein [Proteobacteria bacterium]|nr:HU family DNA-binding protein [Pseudomonadota bacterium]